MSRLFLDAVGSNTLAQHLTRKASCIDGPKARVEPIAGDTDGAARVRGAANDSLIGVAYKRSGDVAFLRALGLGHEPDAKARAARDDALAAKLLRLPRPP